MKWRIVFTTLLVLLFSVVLLASYAAAQAPTTVVDPEGGAPAEGEQAPQPAGAEAVSWRYEFSSSSGTYTEILTGTVHGTASNDDTSFPAVDIGFTFTYDGVDYTAVSIQSNGFIAMGPTVSSSYTPLSTGSSNNVIAALGRDLQGNGTTSALWSATEGTAPNRVFTVQWKDYKRYGSSYVGDAFDFQIKLYETSNLVEVVYGEFTVVYYATPPTIQVGLRGASNADFHNRRTDATHLWANSLRGTANTDFMALTDTIYPASGLTYDWALATGPVLDPPEQGGTDCPGSYLVYQLDVINLTGSTQSFTLDYDSVWPASGPASTGAIPDQGSETISVTVHIPWAAATSDSDVLTVTASEITARATATATVTTVAGLGSGYADYSNVPLGREVRAPSVVYYDGKLYKIGGYNPSAQPWLDIYDIATDTWTAGADMPGPRYWIDCEAIAGKIYCAGGYAATSPYPQSTLYIYDIATNTWTTGADLPAARYNYASAQLGGQYYVIGGYTTTYEATMLVYDPATNTWNSSLASMNTARRYFHAGVIGGKIYVAGGYNLSYLSSAEVYDPAANTWTYVASMPSAWLNGADGVKHDRYLIITGGASSSTGGASNGALFYDAVTDTWAWLPLFNHIIYAAEGDGDGTQFWTVSGRLYEGGAFSYSPYTTLLVQCGECTPVSGADFTVDPASPRPGIPATFSGTATGSPIIDYTWDFGDGGLGTGQVIDHTYIATGTYTVIMTATNCDGSSYDVATQDVIVEEGALIVVDPLALESTQCPDTVMTYTLSICNQGSQTLVYTLTEAIPWLSEDPTGGSVLPGDCVTVEVTFDSAGMAPGTYTGTLRINNNDVVNPVVDVAVTLNVAGPPTNADFTWDPSAPGLNETITFSGTADALLPVDFAWDFGDGNLGSGQSPTHAYAAWGDYTVIMTATLCGGSDVATHTVTVLPCWSVLTEHFEGAFPPANWSVINNGGDCVWQRNDYFATPRPNYAGGDGFCADADSDKCGSGTTMDTELRTMVLDLTGLTTATLEFVTSFNYLGSTGEFANTDISTDGGATWTNLLHWVEDHSPNGPGEWVNLDLTGYAGLGNVMVRFHYNAPGWDWWWEVDQVDLHGCYVPGAAPDIAVTPTELEQTLYPDQTADQTFNIANEGLAVLNWTLDEGCGTPVDWLSLDPLSGIIPVYGDTDVTASFDSTGLTPGTYETTVCVDSDDPDEPTVVVSVTLIVTGAAEIAVDPGALASTQPPDVQVTLPLTICNVGDAPLTWEIGEMPETAQLAAGALPIAVVTIPQSPATPAIADSGEASGTPVIGTPANPIRPDDIGDAWETMAPLPSARVFNAVVAAGPYVYVIGGTSDAGGLTPTDTNFRYNTADNTWTTMAPMPAALAEIDGIAIGGLIYIPGSDPDNNTYVYDTAADTWSAIPANGGYAAPVQYQVVAIGTDLYVLGGIIGGASTPNVWVLDTTTGTWSAGVPMLKSRTSFSAAAIGGNIYVAGGVLYPGFVPDMTAEMFDGTTWSYIAPVPDGGGAYTRWSYNADGMAPGALWLGAGRRDAGWAVLNHAGYYDVATDTWTDSPTIPVLAQGRVYMEGDVAADGYFYVIGGRDAAGAIVYDNNERLMVYNPVQDVPWLSEDPISGTLEAGLCQVTDVTFDSTGLVPDDYFADLVIASNDPYNPEVLVPVTLTVIVPGEPDVVVEPEALDAGLCPDQTEVLTFTVCNEGDRPLDWALSEMSPTVSLGGSAFTPAGALPEGPLPALDATTVSPQAPVVVAPEAPANPEDLLWDQPLSAVNTDAYANQDFEAAYDGYDIFIADDFETGGQWWNIETIFVPGNTWNLGCDLTCADALNWMIFADDGGVPAGDPWGGGDPPVWVLSLAPTDPAVTLTAGTGGYLSNATLDHVAFVGGPLVLPPGFYWLVFYPSMSFDNCCQYGRQPSDTTTGYDAQVINPGGGFGFPTVWTSVQDAATWALVQQDFAFSIEGYIGEPPVDIPWLSEDPTSGTVDPGECQVVEVTFDSTGLEPGDYAASLLIASNDPDTPEINLPVTMAVWEPVSIDTVTYTAEGCSVSFDSTVLGEPPFTYAWDFGDGVGSGEADPVYTYAAPGGTFTVMLTVNNACGEDVWEDTITVSCAPPTRFYYLPIIVKNYD